MAAAISAGDLAEGLSRTNVSAQLAGTEMNNLIGYITTVTDVSQKSASSVGESFKTIFSRLNNAASGKFAKSQAQINELGEEYDPEELLDLNDTETALKAVGIQLRATADSFKKSDDLLQEIASRWDTFTSVQKAGISTSIAGTRQRENFLILMENWDSVSRYAKIAAESQGTAAEKMKAYTDSIEAAQQRVSVALEKLALDLNLTDALKGFYNALTYLVDNIGKIALTLGGVIFAAKGGDIMSSIGTGFTTLSNKAINLNNIYSNILTGGINKEGIKTGLKNFEQNIEEEQKYLIGKKYVDLMNRRAGIVTQGL